MSVRLRSLGSIDAATAQRLLTRYDRTVSRLTRGIPRRERDDFVQVGRLAVLEAYVTHDGRAKLSTWVEKVIRWRLNEAKANLYRPEELAGAPEPLSNGAGLEGRLHVREVLVWLYQEVDRLPSPRQRTILSAVLAGESLLDIARSLGLSKSVVYREAEAARAHIRLRCGKNPPPGVSTLWDDDLGNL